MLAVDDDKRLRALLAQFLRENGFIVNTAPDTRQADEVMRIFRVDAIVLDLMMPMEDGLSYLRRLRGQGTATPVIMLTAMGETGDRIAGLETGADDYLAKPFEPRELLLRINALLRRTEPRAPVESSLGDIAFYGFKYSFARGVLSKGAAKIPLSLTEKVLLEALLKARGQPVSREDLSAASGGNGENMRAVDVQINRLRKKIEQDAGAPEIVKTVRFKGYAIDVY